MSCRQSDPGSMPAAQSATLSDHTDFLPVLSLASPVTPRLFLPAFRCQHGQSLPTCRWLGHTGVPALGSLSQRTKPLPQVAVRAADDMRCPIGDCIAVRGRPRMAEKLQEPGLKVGHGRVGRFPLIAACSDCGAMNARERHQGHQDPEIQGKEG